MGCKGGSHREYFTEVADPHALDEIDHDQKTVSASCDAFSSNAASAAVIERRTESCGRRGFMVSVFSVRPYGPLNS